MKKTHPTISQAGRIAFEGLDATKFWIRALDLQKEIDTALELIAVKPKERELIACPIISEYQLDANLKLIFIILAEVDAIGLQGGGGMIFHASLDREEEVREVRDHYADDLMEALHESDKPHEVIIMEQGKEHDRDL